MTTATIDSALIRLGAAAYCSRVRHGAQPCRAHNSSRDPQMMRTGAQTQFYLEETAPPASRACYVTDRSEGDGEVSLKTRRPAVLPVSVLRME